MKEFIAYLDRKIEEGRAETAGLQAEGRRDDAGFMKAHTNIYEVCRTFTLALADRPGAGIGALKAQTERFRTEWSAALERAKEHGDARGTAVEEAKLSALEDVIAHLREVGEE